MPQIRLDKIAFGYAESMFRNITLTIGSYDKIGIVGNNGCGKSTFLKCIAGLIEPHEGRIICPKGLKFGFIEQTLPKHLETMSFYDALEDIIPAHEKPYSSWKVDYTLDAFKAPNAIRLRYIRDLSGGWQRLALIARAVLSAPDLLLLDEPTNHLDVTKILLLEQWLNEQVNSIPLISVSHDRNFLEQCTTKTLFMRGNEARYYDYTYTRAVELLREDDKATSNQREKESKELKRLQVSAHALRQIGVNNYSAAALRKSNQIAKRAENIEKQLTHVHIDPKRAIKLGSEHIQAKKIFSLNKVNICAPDGSILFHINQLDVRQGERVVIFGQNGSGKSQFLAILNKGVMDLEAAKILGINITPSIKLGYVDQHMSQLPDSTIMNDYIQDRLMGDRHKTTGALIQAGFPIAMHNMQLKLLSPGQRARIAFLALHLLQPNVYIMDEPTNHLDIEGQEQLEAELLEQGATALVISHDRAFTKIIGTTFYMIDQQRLKPIASPQEYYKHLSNLEEESNDIHRWRKG